MLVPTEDSDYSTFFYLLKKKLEKKKMGKIFVPISHLGYSNKYWKKSQFEDIENYLWIFTKDWPLVYEVYDKKDELSIQIVGETEVYSGIRTLYKVKLKDRIEANKFYKLIKALFMLQTEVPNYFKFETNIDEINIVLNQTNLHIERKNVDLLTPNETELEIISGVSIETEEDIQKALDYQKQ